MTEGAIALALLLGLGAACCVGAIVAWSFFSRYLRPLRASERSLKERVERLNAANARAEEEQTRLQGRVTSLEAERNIITEILRRGAGAAGTRFNGKIAQFNKVEECGSLIGPNGVLIYFDVKGLSQHAWDVVQSAEGRERENQWEYLEAIPVAFELRIASKRGALFIAINIEVCEPYDRLGAAKQLPQRPAGPPRYSVDWGAGGIVEP